MKRRMLQFAVCVGLLATHLSSGADAVPEIKVAKTVTRKPSGNQQLPSEFNYGRSFVISFNQNFSRSDNLKTNLAASLAQRGVVDRVVFDFFSSKKQPDFVEVKFGSRVPLDISQSVIEALSKTSDIKITLALENVDGNFGDTQRVYIGSLTQRPQKPVTSEKLRSLLEPQLRLKQFHDIILENN